MERSEGVILSFPDFGKRIIVEGDAVFAGDIKLRLIDDDKGRTISVYMQRHEVRALIEALAQMARLKCTVEE